MIKQTNKTDTGAKAKGDSGVEVVVLWLGWVLSSCSRGWGGNSQLLALECL